MSDAEARAYVQSTVVRSQQQRDLAASLFLSGMASAAAQGALDGARRGQNPQVAAIQGAADYETQYILNVIKLIFFGAIMLGQFTLFGHAKFALISTVLLWAFYEGWQGNRRARQTP